MVGGAGVQVPPLLLLVAHTSNVDLDAQLCEVLIESGILKIRDRERRLLAKVKHSHNRLYLIDLKVEQPVCLQHGTPRSRGYGMPDSAISASTCSVS